MLNPRPKLGVYIGSSIVYIEMLLVRKNMFDIKSILKRTYVVLFICKLRQKGEFRISNILYSKCTRNWGGQRPGAQCHIAKIYTNLFQQERALCAKYSTTSKYFSTRMRVGFPYIINNEVDAFHLLLTYYVVSRLILCGSGYSLFLTHIPMILPGIYRLVRRQMFVTGTHDW